MHITPATALPKRHLSTQPFWINTYAPTHLPPDIVQRLHRWQALVAAWNLWRTGADLEEVKAVLVDAGLKDTERMLYRYLHEVADQVAAEHPTPE